MPLSSVPPRQQFASKTSAARLLRDASASSTAAATSSLPLCRQQAGRVARRAEENLIADPIHAEAFQSAEAAGRLAALHRSRLGRHSDRTTVGLLEEVSLCTLHHPAALSSRSSRRCDAALLPGEEMIELWAAVRTVQEMRQRRSRNLRFWHMALCTAERLSRWSLHHVHYATALPDAMQSDLALVMPPAMPHTARHMSDMFFSSPHGAARLPCTSTWPWS